VCVCTSTGRCAWEIELKIHIFITLVSVAGQWWFCSLSLVVEGLRDRLNLFSKPLSGFSKTILYPILKYPVRFYRILTVTISGNKSAFYYIGSNLGWYNNYTL
jgi:hypothetical protein